MVTLALWAITLLRQGAFEIAATPELHRTLSRGNLFIPYPQPWGPYFDTGLLLDGLGSNCNLAGLLSH